MTTLDEILSDLLDPKLEENLRAATNLSDWTPQNKDAKVEEIAGVVEQYIEASISTVESFMTTVVDGHSVMYWAIKRNLLQLMISFFSGLRAELDVSDELERAEYPVTYDWITEQIHGLYDLVKQIDILLNRQKQEMDGNNAKEV